MDCVDMVISLVFRGLGTVGFLRDVSVRSEETVGERITKVYHA